MHPKYEILVLFSIYFMLFIFIYTFSYYFHYYYYSFKCLITEVTNFEA